MSRSCTALLCLAVVACAPRSVTSVAAPTVPARLTAAEALVRAGCFACLAAAHQDYDALRAHPLVRDRATIGAIRTAALLAIRQRELGMADTGYLARARDLVAG